MNTAENMSGQEPSKKERDETSPTVEYILGGKADIKLLSESRGSKWVEDVHYMGRVCSYEISVPNVTRPDEMLTTELSVWFLDDGYPAVSPSGKKRPEMQIDIFTGQGPMQGQMKLSGQREILDRVYAEIRRQTDNSSYLEGLRSALNTKNFALLRATVNGIQRFIHGTNSKRQLGRLDDEDVHKLLETGRGMITVGIGTQGQRIFIKDGQLYMPTGDAKSEEQAKEFRLNFQRLFNLPDIQDLRVTF